MNKSKRKSATVFSRDEIGVEQLQSLKEKFADGDLNEKEFVSLFREIIDASLSETQLTELFQKIDANSDGTVDWDELTNYMFLSGSDNSSEFIGDDCNAYYETYQPEKLGEGATPDATGAGGVANSGTSASGSVSGLGSSSSDGSSTARSATHHKDLITRVLRLDKPSLYLTASKDGSVRTWNVHTLQLQSVITTGKNWLTDCCVMKRSNRLAVTSMNRTLGIYDLGSNALIGEITEYSSRKAIPLCVEYVEKPADDREALVIGDDTGGITVMTCSDLWMACDGRSTGPATSGSSSSSSGTTSSSSGGGAMGVSLETHGFSSRTKFKKHTDWVTRVKWVHDMRAIVATSLDTNISIIDVDRMVVKFEYNRHKKGVFDLVWCASTRLIASCGMERDISIWNPYSSQRAVATLRGHTSSVVQVVSDDDNYQILSVASDNTFKVWDVRNHRCLQTWVDRAKSTGGAEHRIAALLFDGKQQPCLLSATTHLTRWPFKVHDADGDPGSGGGDGGASAAEKPMTLASYNAVFHQVVTAEISAASVVKTWSAETGDEICSFTNAHGQSPVTAIAFDYPGRRLLTGSHDGAVIKMWNFSNGALVKQFHKQQRSDTATTDGVASSSASSSAAGISGIGGVTTSLPLADDLSFLGLDGDDGDGETDAAAKKSGANKKPTAATATTPLTLPTSPRKRNKVRDIMLLPPTFGVDIEGRKNPQTLSAYTELPSPTRTQLHAKGDNATGLQSTHSPRRGTSNQADAHPQDTEPASPSARRSSGSTSTAATPALAAATYCEKEVTSILDIERNLRVGMGDYICQRFVCCVGWDRSVFVWADKNDESEALPTHVLPPPSTQQSSTTKCHTMDVLALVYIPPAYVATAGLDGTILLWSINSGDFLSRVYQSSGSIDTMVYAQKIEMLFAAGETGELICVDRSMTPRAVVPLEHPHHEAVTAIRCDRTNTHLVTGDVAGYLKVWDLSISLDHAGLVLDVCCLWRVPTGGSASSARVLALDFVEHVRVSEPFLLVSSGNGDVTLWTLDGVQVGCFGRHRTWQLGRPTTYLATTSECIWPETSGLSTPELNRERVSHPSAVLAATQTRPELIDCFSIAALRGSETVRDSFLLEDLMPKPGEVWVCVSGHRSTRAAAMGAKKAGGAVGGGGGGETIERTAATNDRRSSSMGGGGGERGGESSLPSSSVMPTLLRPVSMSTSRRSSFVDIVGAAAMRETLSSLPFLQQRLAEIASDVTDLITVVKVTRGEISCWDGHSHRPPVLKVLEMSEFVRRAGWVKQPLLTQYIGRVFADDTTHFQVTGISLVAVDSNKPDRKVFSLIDTHGQDHGVRPLSEAVSTARVKVQAQLEQRRLQQVTGDASASRPTQTPRKRLTTMPTASTLPIESNASSKTADENGGSAQSIESVSPGPPTSAMTLTTSVTAAHVLPLIKPKERRSMGGMLPKRSSVRMRHDQSVDFRRIHVPQEMPKNFRAALNQCMQAIHGGGGQSTSAASTQASSRSGRSSLRFDGVLPE